ncbi:MAG: transglycosylase SLT domain-containing protein [Gammaproteobacteria bacterium]|nr:transglycosylase SLT domain-containing protein [Gammaproteobacteria bacterium]
MISEYTRHPERSEGSPASWWRSLAALGMTLPILRMACWITFLLFTHLAFASPQTHYLQRFQTYITWRDNLPAKPDAPFLQFISEDSPLANKLRERWLYLLAQKKDWKTYLAYYKKSNQTALNCYAEYAHYLNGQSEAAMNASRSIWLSGNSLPAACNTLFEVMRHDPHFDERFIDARIVLSLNQDNPQLANYLLGLYRPPRQQDISLLNQISKHPTDITALPRDRFHGYFYVFGLKRLVAQKQNEAIRLYQQALVEKRLTDTQQQQFLSFLALYKALRNDADADAWFNQVKPAFYNEALLDWQIRLALKQLNWPRVETLIHYYQNKSDPCWQYWLARALEAQGKTEQAQAMYQAVAKTRHYYGFLASLRLHHPFHFESEPTPINLELIKPYQAFTEKITYLHQHQQKGEASRLLNDFTSELPMDEKISLIHWIGQSLNWYGQSIELCNHDDLKNQLALRFPLPFKPTITSTADTYHLPPAFIYAIIRQESTFKSDIVSPAGARGLMQLMPRTASMMAKDHRIAYHHQDDLFQSQTNIVLGVAYLNFLARHFQHHPLLMAAAYNAGPKQVIFWLRTHPPKEIDIWIETLPWRETRNYLKNVIAFYAVYQHQLKQKSSLDLMMRPLQTVR